MLWFVSVYSAFILSLIFTIYLGKHHLIFSYLWTNLVNKNVKTHVLNLFFSDAEVRTITKDRNEFKQALASIRLHSDYNYDCPEKAMTGIELGLTNSLPGSYLYVFTDASANDYHKFEHVKTLAQKKQSQVIIYCVLTATFQPIHAKH